MNIDLIILILLGAFSALITFILNVKLNQGHVRASALVGVSIGCFILFCPNLLSDYFTQNLPLVCFGASFVGMVSHKVISNYFLIAIAGAVFTLLFLNLSSIFNGFGGGLGATACLAVLITLSIPVLLRIKNNFIK